MTRYIRGIDVEGFKRGWNNVSSLAIPFDVEKYLEDGQAEIKFGRERKKVSFRRDDGLFVFSCGNTQLRHSMRLFREWRNESLDMVLWLESVAVGECTRKIIQGERLLD